jgi:uncharacterized membrane protein
MRRRAQGHCNKTAGKRRSKEWLHSWARAITGLAAVLDALRALIEAITKLLKL